jgi:hypothetical protein
MMDEKELERFREGALAACQECIATNPVIVLGSGASVPFGLPTMDFLGQSIKTSVESEIDGVCTIQNG